MFDIDCIAKLGASFYLGFRIKSWTDGIDLSPPIFAIIESVEMDCLKIDTDFVQLHDSVVVLYDPKSSGSDSERGSLTGNDHLQVAVFRPKLTEFDQNVKSSLLPFKNESSTHLPGSNKHPRYQAASCPRV